MAADATAFIATLSARARQQLLRLTMVQHAGGGGVESGVAERAFFF